MVKGQLPPNMAEHYSSFDIIRNFVSIWATVVNKELEYGWAIEVWLIVAVGMADVVIERLKNIRGPSLFADLQNCKEINRQYTAVVGDINGLICCYVSSSTNLVLIDWP